VNISVCQRTKSWRRLRPNFLDQIPPVTLSPFPSYRICSFLFFYRRNDPHNSSWCVYPFRSYVFPEEDPNKRKPSQWPTWESRNPPFVIFTRWCVGIVYPLQSRSKSPHFSLTEKEFETYGSPSLPICPPIILFLQ